MGVIEEIKEKLQKNELILFVGAGVPNTLGLPTWSSLMKEIAERLDYDYELFELYGDYPALAEFYSLSKGGLDELTDWMKNNWSVDDAKIREAQIYQGIVRLGCKLIYTTNYDDSLEKAHRLNGVDYVTVAGIRDIVGIAPNAVQIVKFHGDLQNGCDLVLTESNYFQRLDFESPLDIKLRADLLGKSLLFIGYRLSDINMRLMIYKVNSLWKAFGRGENVPQSYIFLSRPDPIQEKIFESRNVHAIVGESADSGKNLEDFLKRLNA